MHNIVILGGNFAGVSTAHYLLRHVIPPLHSTNGGRSDYKVTLVSPSDHTFFMIAAPRALISAELVPLEKPFGSIPDAFCNYKTSEFKFVQGEAIKVPEDEKVVDVRLTRSSANVTIRYDLLVIATGTTSPSPLWTLHGHYGNTAAAFEGLHERLPKAKTILIVGGGPTGVEVAGEIGHHYKGKDITLLSGGSRLLPRLKHIGVGKAAERQLKVLNVKIIHNTKAISRTELANGQVSVNLSDDGLRTFDLYIDATSGAPNTKFIPATWLNDTKHVATDANTLRATKSPPGVYSIGDVSSFSKGSAIDAIYPIPALGYSIWSDLCESVNRGKGGLAGTAILKEEKYKQIGSDVQFVPIGPEGGVGVAFGWQVPSCIVSLLKSRTFFMDKAPKLATGEDFVKP
ncbi:FAD/NAD(P)-binding domain-containing protein [Cadophora sp. DSE1049]|nr:FAD/NAD(P)-binding domain-containing protein [Cadophora sp. DSE1049]